MRDRLDLPPLRVRSTLRRMIRPFSGVSLLAVGLVACGGDATSPSTAADLAQSYWTLHLNQHAVLLALTPGQDTIYLTATARNVSGQPVSGLGPIHYTARDSTVTVDAMGLVTAHYVTAQRTAVVATLTDTVHHITQRDTCFLQVTATPSSTPLAGFTLQSPSGDTMPLGQYYTVMTSATDAQGNPVTVMSYFQSADSSIAAVDKFSGYLIGGRVGQVMLYAETWAYGVAKRDSLELTVNLPGTAQIFAVPVAPTGSAQTVLTFWPQIVRVSAGAVVAWQNESYSDSLDVVFDDTTNVDSAQYGAFIALAFATGRGNIAPWVYDTLGTNSVSAEFCQRYQAAFPGAGTCVDILTGLAGSNSKRRLREFPVTGTYHYHSAIWGSSGTIIVQ